MDMGPLSFSVCVMMFLLLGSSRLSRGNQNNCPCPKIPPWLQTEPPPEHCYDINSSYRYICVDGYVRKVGTSNLTRCKKIEGAVQWSTPTLECIPDPKKPRTEPPMSTTNTISNCPCPKIPLHPDTKPPPEACHQINSRYYYICVEGYLRKAGTSASIICLETDGKPKWTTATLECKPDPRISTIQPANNNLTTTTPTTVQTTRSLNTFASVEEGAGSTEPITSEGSMTPSAVQTEKSKTSSSTISPPAPYKSVSEAAGISVSLLIICAVIVIIFLLYRRRSRNNSNSNQQQCGEEEVPMNVVPVTVE